MLSCNWRIQAYVSDNSSKMKYETTSTLCCEYTPLEHFRGDQCMRFIFKQYAIQAKPNSSVIMANQNIPTLQKRRGNIIYIYIRLALFYSIVNNLVTIRSELYIQLQNSRTRTKHTKAHTQIRSNSDIYKNRYFLKSLKDWNTLDSAIILSGTSDLSKLIFLKTDKNDNRQFIGVPIHYWQLQSSRELEAAFLSRRS